jgi:non-ribosomal peptide synthetase component F
MLNHFFLSSDVQMKKSIYNLSLILPDERLLMQSINNTQVLFSPLTCIHHEFVNQAMKYSQKLGIELDDQSLTYCELLHYAQALSLNLLNNHQIIPGEIVCQCVERSISMVS